MPEPFITFFTAPKPFTNAHINIIQRNAILSWKKLGDAVEIFLMGADEGIDRAAADFDVRHFPQVRCNERGTPLISSMLELVRANSHSPFLCIINTDILVMPDILQTVKTVSQKMEKFILVGQRWDVEVTSLFEDRDPFFLQIERSIQEKGHLHPPTGSDYFLFPRVCFPSIPDFAIGRAGWDNWMIYKARYEGWQVIDASHAITIAHQSHDYSHLENGKPHYRQPETYVNVDLAGGEYAIFTLRDAQRRIVDGQIKHNPMTWKRFCRAVEIMPTTLLKSQPLAKVNYTIFHPRKTYSQLRAALKKNLVQPKK
ncbi:MAG TPA: hypothetical protein DCK95_11225 [Anaerolineaceae bacterium]|nr:hypothetical protein [Anaerolineaceae bacterium]